MQKDKHGNLVCAKHGQDYCNPRCDAFLQEYAKLFKCGKCGGQLEFKDNEGKPALLGILQPHTCLLGK